MSSLNELDDRLTEAGFQSVRLTGSRLWINEEFVGPSDALRFQERLREEINWIQPVVRMGARTFNSPRLSAWHGDPEATYTYSGLRNDPLPWNDLLLKLRDALENATGVGFNSVLLNLYRNGSDSMGWHADNEPELGECPIIASLSLGESRKFVMKHRKLGIRWERMLGHGSALIMAGETQQWWRHCVPKSRTQTAERINLTFREVRH